MKLRNHTAFGASPFLTADREGRESLCVVVKATFDLLQSGAKLQVAEEQAPIVPADRHGDDPATSSVTVAGDLCPGKPGTDLLLRGRAHSGGRRPAVVDVVFAAGNRGRRVRVFGDRVWEKSLGFAKIPDPAPFETIPLTWENAFGGWDRSPEDPAQHEHEPRNPVGKGFRAKKSRLPVPGQPLPNLEDPAKLIRKPGDRPPPAGFGPIAAHWTPRAGYAGTYDDAWMKNRMPLLPDDFDPRFLHRAPAGLVLDPPPAPGTPIRVVGASASGPIRFALPEVSVAVEVYFLARRVELDLHLDTVLVDADAPQLVMSLSGATPVQGEVEDVVLIAVRPAGRMLR